MRSRRFRVAALFVSLMSVADCARDIGDHPDLYGIQVAPLVEAVGTSRPIEGRLTGGFRYGQWRQMRGTNRDLQVGAAVARLQQTGTSDHAKAVAALVDGDADGAISTLERSASHSQKLASIASDLAAAQLARWQHAGAALDAARALDNADRAIVWDPAIPEGLFNRALALDALGLTELGGEAWHRYTQLDPNSDWSKEAAGRALRDEHRISEATASMRRAQNMSVSALVQPRPELIEREPRLVRQELDNELLADWIIHQANQRTRRNNSVWTAQVTLARALAARTGDPFWRSLTSELDSVPSEHRRAVTAAVHDLISARTYIDANRFDLAAPLLEGLAARLTDVPTAQLAVEFWKQYALWYRGDKLATVSHLTRLRQHAAARQFTYFEARCWLMLAGSLESLARYDEAALAFRVAIERFNKIQEVDFAASARAMLAQVLSLQGDLNEAWEDEHAALDGLSIMTSRRQRVVVLANAVVIGERGGLPFAALELQKALIAEVGSWHDNGALARYYIERSRLCNDLGMTALAKTAIDDGLRVVHAISDASDRSIFDLDLQIESARMDIELDPKRAAKVLARAIELLPRTNRDFKLADVYLDLGRAKLRAGDAEGAMQAWFAGIDVFEEQRRRITGEALRISFYSRAWDLYDEAITEAVAQNRLDTALGLVERSRARALRDALTTSSSVFELHEFQSHLPTGTVLLTFASLRDSLLVWCIDRSRVTFARLAYSVDDLRDLVENVRSEVAERGGGPAGAQFTDTLDASFDGQLASARRLVVVPDGPLGGLPFAALPWGHDGSLVVDHLTLLVSPSLSVFDDSSGRLSVLERQRAETAVFIADPAVDRAVYPTLNRLPSSRREVEESAQFYRHPQLFVGAEATGSVLSKALGTADVVHFAGHAIADPEFPLRATLVVAPDGTRPGFVHPTELEHAKRHPRTRLVILSACSTVNATSTFGEGALSLARPFLASGVPTVLGTLWDVDDGDAAALVPRFHRWLQAGSDPADALRRAQLEMKTGPDEALRRPRSWSGFVVIGGSDPFLSPAGFVTPSVKR